MKYKPQNHYYPFGLKHSLFTSGSKKDYKFDENAPEGAEELARPGFVTSIPYKYKYQGQERQDELGLNMYDYGARNYDPALGRWHNIDPLAADHVYQLNEKTGEMKKIEHNDDATDSLVAENGDVIADNITKAVFNEAESINIQENGLVIDSFNTAGANYMGNQLGNSAKLVGQENGFNAVQNFIFENGIQSFHNNLQGEVIKQGFNTSKYN